MKQRRYSVGTVVRQTVGLHIGRIGVIEQVSRSHEGDAFWVAGIGWCWPEHLEPTDDEPTPVDIDLLRWAAQLTPGRR